MGRSQRCIHRVTATLFVGWIAALCVSAPVAAQDSNTALIGKWANGPASSFAIDGSIAYSGAGGVLRVVDLTDPDDPIVLREQTLPSAIFGMKASGDHLFVLTARQGLRVFDITEPTNLFEVGFLEVDLLATSIDLAGDFAYITNGLGLIVADVSDPTSPFEVAFVTTGASATHVDVVGGKAYVADWTDGVRIYDVTNPSSPSLLGQFVPLPIGLVESVVVSGDLAFCGDWQGLRVVDVSDPTNPQQIGFLDGFAVFDLDVSGSEVFVSDGTGLRVIDVSDPINPVTSSILAGVHFGDIYYSVQVVDDTVYLADSIEGFKVIDVSDPTSPFERSRVAAWGYTYAVKALGDRAYIANGNRGLRVLDISDPARPIELGGVDTDHVAFGVDARGDFVYVADGESGLRIIDVSDGANPVEVGFYTADDWVYDVAIEGDLAYLANGNLGVAIVDVSNPKAPVFRGRFDFNFRCGASQDFPFVRGVDVENSIVFAAEENCGLRIIDATNPEDPVSLSSTGTFGSATKVIAEGDLAYVASGSAGVRVLDVEDLSNPFFRGAFIGTSANDIAISNGYAYVASFWAGIFLLDISDPDALVEVGSFETGYSAVAVDASGLRVHVADGMDGYYIVQNTAEPAAVPGASASETASLQLRAGPNPLTPNTTIRYRLPEATHVELTVYDAAGRSVSRLVDEPQPSGDHFVRFDGTNLPSGVYRYRLQAGALAGAGAFVLVQ